MDPVAAEIKSTLSHWLTASASLYSAGDRSVVYEISKACSELIDAYHRLCDDILSTHSRYKTRQAALQILTKGNSLLDLWTVPQGFPSRVGNASSKIGLCESIQLYGDYEHKLKCASSSSAANIFVRIEEWECPMTAHHDLELRIYLINAATGAVIYHPRVYQLQPGAVLAPHCLLFPMVPDFDVDCSMDDQVHVYGLLRIFVKCSKLNPTICTGCNTALDHIFTVPLANAVFNVRWNATCTKQKARFFMGGSNEFLTLNELQRVLSSRSISDDYRLVVATDIIVGTQLETLQHWKNIDIMYNEKTANISGTLDNRDALHVTVTLRHIEKITKTSAKNVELIVQLVDYSGNSIDGCFVQSPYNDTCLSEHRCPIYTNQTAPKWAEPFLILLPMQNGCYSMNKAHVRFLFYSATARSEKIVLRLFAFSFMPICNARGLCIADGSHRLVILKCDSMLKLKDPSRYLSQAWQHNSISVTPSSTGGSFQPIGRDALQIVTELHSTSITNCALVSDLLRPNGFANSFCDVLSNLKESDYSAVCPLYSRLLRDALESVQSDERKPGSRSKRPAVYDCFLLFDIVHRTNKSLAAEFQHTLQAYLRNSGPIHITTAKAMLKTVICCFSDALDYCQSGVRCRSDFSIIASNLSTIINVAMHVEEADLSIVRTDLKVLFDCVLSVTAASEPWLHDYQINICGNLANILNDISLELDANFASVLLQQVICSFHDSTVDIQRSTAQIAALATMISVNDSFICHASFTNVEQLLIDVFHLLAKRMQERHTLQDITGLTALSSEHLWKVLNGNVSAQCQKKIVFAICTSVCDELVGCALALSHEHESKFMVQLACSLFDLFELALCCNCLRDIFDHIQHKGKRQLKDFFLQYFLLLQHIFGGAAESGCWRSASAEAGPIIQDKWRAPRHRINRTILGLTFYIRECLSANYLEGDSFDFQLWHAHLQSAVNFIGQPFLQSLHNCDDSDSDRRVQMAQHVATSWQCIKSRRSHFEPVLLLPLMEVSLLANRELRLHILPLTFELLYSNDVTQNGLKLAEEEFLARLDLCMTTRPADAEYKALFEQIYMDGLSGLDERVAQSAVAFVGRVSQLLDLLLELQAAREQTDDGAFRQMACLHELLVATVPSSPPPFKRVVQEFYKTMAPREQTHKCYVHRLHDVLVAGGFHIEAAHCLLLHADLLHWNAQPLPPFLAFAAQTEAQRKQDLYRQAIGYYDRAKVGTLERQSDSEAALQHWEGAVALCKELIEFYEQRVFDYLKLSNLLRRQADFYDKILGDTQRHSPQYFRVAYVGQAFPSFVRNQTFVYRSKPFDSILTFTQRLAAEWPNARVSSLVDGRFLDALSAEQQIVVTHVKPHSDRLDVLSSSAADHIKAYYKHNEVRRFQFSRTLPRDPRLSQSRVNEFQDLWTERTTVSVLGALPAVLPWAAVVSESSERVSPASNACAAVAEKNEELRCVLPEDSARRSTAGKHALMLLKGAVEANVNGGIAMYQQAFFTTEYAVRYPAEMDKLHELRRLLLEQLQLLDKCLRATALSVSPEYRPLHEHLCRCYERLRRDVRRNLDSSRMRQLMLAASVKAKSSLPSSPDRNSMPGASSLLRQRHLAGSVPLALRGSSWDNSWAAPTEWSGSEISCSTGMKSDEESFLTGDDETSRRRSKVQVRPFSVHWESSAEQLPALGGMQAHLSDSNLVSHYGNATRRRAGRLRRIMSRLSSGGGSPRTPPTRSPRRSLDVGLQKVARRARSPPLWGRKLSAPLAALQSRIPRYRPLRAESAPNDSDSQRQSADSDNNGAGKPLSSRVPMEWLSPVTAHMEKKRRRRVML